MAVKTKRIRINSVVVDRDFLDKLGAIFEEQIEEIKKNAETKVTENSPIVEKEVNRWWGTLSTGQKSKKIQEKLELVRQQNTQYYRIKYTLSTEEYDLDFNSIKELSAVKYFPEKIKSISFNFSTNSEGYVDINIPLNNEYFTEVKVTLSSGDEEKLLKYENKIKDLFKNRRTDYNWMFKIGSKFFCLNAISALLSVMILVLIYKIWLNISPSLDTKQIVGSLFFLGVIVVMLLSALIKYLYPYYHFELSKISFIY